LAGVFLENEKKMRRRGEGEERESSQGADE